MDKLTFFTPIHYPHPEKFTDSLLETVDDYFYWGGKKATVISKETLGKTESVLISDFSVKSNAIQFAAKVLKFLSYLTLVIPAAALIVKGCLRSQHQFKVLDAKAETDSVIAKIRDCIFSIVWKVDNPEISWVSKETGVFKLKGYPDLEFESANGDKAPQIADKKIEVGDLPLGATEFFFVRKIN